MSGVRCCWWGRRKARFILTGADGKNGRKVGRDYRPALWAGAWRSTTLERLRPSIQIDCLRRSGAGWFGQVDAGPLQRRRQEPWEPVGQPSSSTDRPTKGDAHVVTAPDGTAAPVGSFKGRGLASRTRSLDRSGYRLRAGVEDAAPVSARPTPARTLAGVLPGLAAEQQG